MHVTSTRITCSWGSIMSGHLLARVTSTAFSVDSWSRGRPSAFHWRISNGSARTFSNVIPDVQGISFSIHCCVQAVTSSCLHIPRDNSQEKIKDKHQASAFWSIQQTKVRCHHLKYQDIKKNPKDIFQLYFRIGPMIIKLCQSYRYFMQLRSLSMQKPNNSTNKCLISDNIGCDLLLEYNNKCKSIFDSITEATKRF